MCTKTSQKVVSSVIDSLGVMETGLRPDCMELDLEVGLYHYQCDAHMTWSPHGTVKPTKGLAEPVPDSVRRSRECIHESDVILQRLTWKGP